MQDRDLGERIAGRAVRRPGEQDLSMLPLRLERDWFMRNLLSELSATLQDMIGLEEASGFFSVIGQNMGRQIDQDYRQALRVKRLRREQVAAVMVNLKQRIGGDFYLISQNDEQIILGSRSCPFAEQVQDRPAMCMMTSNIFGAIAGENLGYAKVELQETIALGASGCKIVVYLKQSPAAISAQGREYVRIQTD